MIRNPPRPADAMFRQAVLDAIKHAPTPTDTKQRILKAREWGLLDDAEAGEWIALFGVMHD